jgi:hypothetical protein
MQVEKEQKDDAYPTVAHLRIAYPEEFPAPIQLLSQQPPTFLLSLLLQFLCPVTRTITLLPPYDQSPIS